jgi:hypothetical protein
MVRQSRRQGAFRHCFNAYGVSCQATVEVTASLVRMRLVMVGSPASPEGDFSDYHIE